MPAPALYDINIRYRGYEWNDEYARKGITTFLRMVKSFAMAKLSVTRYAMSPKAAGSTNPRSRCRKRRRLTPCLGRPKCRSRCRRWKITPLKVTATPTAAWAPKTCWVLPPACTAWQTLRTTWLKLSNATCCRNT